MGLQRKYQDESSSMLRASIRAVRPGCHVLDLR
jgi:hypothetical protein